MATFTTTYAVGGAFDDAATQSLAKKVLNVAVCSICVQFIGVIVTFADPFNRLVLSGDLIVEGSNTATIIGNSIVALAIAGGILYCGVAGAKQRNGSLLCCFSVINFICAALQLCALLSFVGLVSILGGTCSVYSTFGFSPASCYISLVLALFAMSLFFASGVYGYQLKNQVSVIVVQQVNVPVNTVQYTPAGLPPQKVDQVAAVTPVATAVPLNNNV